MSAAVTAPAVTRDGRGDSDTASELRRSARDACDASAGESALRATRTLLRRFVAFPTEHELTAVTLWAAHAHVVHAFDSTPRLALLSPEPGSGKTRVLELLELLTPRPLHAVNPNPAPVFRLIQTDRPTLLLDEVDALWSARGEDGAEALRGLLNAGHRQGAVIPRCVGPNQVVENFPVFCAVALAGLGQLPDTLMTRSVVVRMRRRAPGDRVEPFRRRDVEHPGTEVRDALADWLLPSVPELSHARPVMPPGVQDRAADVWEALLAVADLAGGGWPQEARAACVHLTTAAGSRDASLGVQLLRDLRLVFDDLPNHFTDDLIGRLCALTESPWLNLGGESLTPRRLAGLLREYGVTPRTVRIGDRTAKGYTRQDLWDPWTRYLPPTPAEAEQAAQAEHPRSTDHPL